MLFDWSVNSRFKHNSQNINILQLIIRKANLLLLPFSFEFIQLDWFNSIAYLQWVSGQHANEALDRFHTRQFNMGWFHMNVVGLCQRPAIQSQPSGIVQCDGHALFSCLFSSPYIGTYMYESEGGLNRHIIQQLQNQVPVDLILVMKAPYNLWGIEQI